MAEEQAYMDDVYLEPEVEIDSAVVEADELQAVPVTICGCCFC